MGVQDTGRWASRAAQQRGREEIQEKQNNCYAFTRCTGLLWKEPGYWVEGEPVPPCWVTPEGVLGPRVGVVEDNSRKKSEFKVRLCI